MEGNQVRVSYETKVRNLAIVRYVCSKRSQVRLELTETMKKFFAPEFELGAISGT